MHDKPGREQFGLMQALASERLMTDGAEVLYDFAATTDDPEAKETVDGLVVTRSGQQVFRPVVSDYPMWSRSAARGFPGRRLNLPT